MIHTVPFGGPAPKNTAGLSTEERADARAILPADLETLFI
jgi:hypothetical protein